jgi:hypothetical protein
MLMQSDVGGVVCVCIAPVSAELRRGGYLPALLNYDLIVFCAFICSVVLCLLFRPYGLLSVFTGDFNRCTFCCRCPLRSAVLPFL